MIEILNVLRLSTLALAALAPSPTPSPSPGACDNVAAHRLDFWIGTWEVRNPAGGREGHNVIERVLGGCAILEHWTDADGSAGKSLFYLDGRVRQVIEQSADGGQTWRAWEGLYSEQEKP